MTFESAHKMTDIAEDKAFLLTEKDQYHNIEEGQSNISFGPRRPRLLLYIILLSFALNLFQAIWIGFFEMFSSEMNYPDICHDQSESIAQPLYPPSVYEWTVNSISTDKRFKAFNPDEGIVALPKGQPNILPSEQFPWDSSKEIYVLSGYHSLHSLQVIWQYLHRLSGNESLSSHVLHSLNVLWEDVICAANPTPMSISHHYVTNRTAITEAGQTRQCRDWKALEEFRVENTACFKDLGAARHKVPMIEEWQFCPDDSPYKNIVDNYIAQLGK